MQTKNSKLSMSVAAAVGMVLAAPALATEPCGDFGECKALVEINSSDGDIGFHFLMDGDDIKRAALFSPKKQKLFYYTTRRELRQQSLTETFAESAEPLCFDPTTDDDPENDDEDFVTLEDFLDRWTPGKYKFFGINGDWEFMFGQTKLTFNLPAAPQNLTYTEEMDGDDVEGEISWTPGDDLGECSDGMEMLPMAPADVPVAAWEVVMEPDVDGLIGSYTYVVRIPGDAEELEVEVPDDYLETLPDNTPVKIEVGAIGFDDNATFTEEGDICINETEEDGCGFEDEDEDERKTSLTGIILVAGLLTLSGLALLRPDSESLVFESSESSQIAVPQTAIVTGDGREQDIQRGLDFLDEAYERYFYLETVLLHGEPGDRKAAVRELKKSSDANVVALLSLALADPDVRVRQAAFEALSEIGGEEAMSAIASAMHQSDPKVRASAAEALATTEGYSAPNYLEIALHDDNPRVRQAAIEALGVVGDSRSINIISAALRDPDEAVRERAAEILDELNDDAMFEVFYSTF